MYSRITSTSRSTIVALSQGCFDSRSIIGCTARGFASKSYHGSDSRYKKESYFGKRERCQFMQIVLDCPCNESTFSGGILFLFICKIKNSVVFPE
jgi:hypothetical protein